MEYPKITFVPDDGVTNQGAFFDDDKDDWFTFIDFADNHLPANYARRMVAAWNYCEGVPTAELESKGATAGFWGRACSRLKGKNDKLQEENAAIRAAVREMDRMLPLIEIIEGDYEDIWNMATKNSGFATLNDYRQTLENALAKMNEK